MEKGTDITVRQVGNGFEVIPVKLNPGGIIATEVSVFESREGLHRFIERHFARPRKTRTGVIS